MAYQLTIAIPTYKRPELLYKNVKEILLQCQGTDLVDILVIDDSCGEGNVPCIKRLENEFPQARLSLLVNSTNLGIDENIKKCIYSASGDFVWLLGEDDLLTAGSIAKVCSAINKYNPVFLFANYIYANDTHELLAEKSVLGEFSPGAIEYEFNDFLKNYVWALGFIGGCVIRAADWRSQNIQKFKGSFYSHVGGIIDAAVDKKIVVIGDILVLNRAEDVNTFTWSASTFPVYFSFYDVLNKSVLRLNSELLKLTSDAAAKLFAIYSLPWLAAKRADGVYNKAIYEDYYRRSQNSVWWHLTAAVISVLPRAPLSYLRRIHLNKRFSRRV